MVTGIIIRTPVHLKPIRKSDDELQTPVFSAEVRYVIDSSQVERLFPVARSPHTVGATLNRFSETEGFMQDYTAT